MKDKIKALTKYLNSIEDRLTSPLPAKHLNRPHTYLQFLKNEQASTKAKLERLKSE